METIKMSWTESVESQMQALRAEIKKIRLRVMGVDIGLRQIQRTENIPMIDGHVIQRSREHLEKMQESLQMLELIGYVATDTPS